LRIITINIIELNNAYKDGWKYTDFELEFKKRPEYNKKQCQETFQKLIEQNDITERSPGLYWRILGFDKFH
jgi:uncharacterized protein YjbK